LILYRFHCLAASYFTYQFLLPALALLTEHGSETLEIPEKTEDSTHKSQYLLTMYYKVLHSCL
jgi:hypothetical protein